MESAGQFTTVHTTTTHHGVCATKATRILVEPTFIKTKNFLQLNVMSLRLQSNLKKLYM